MMNNDQFNALLEYIHEVARHYAKSKDYEWAPWQRATVKLRGKLMTQPLILDVPQSMTVDQMQERIVNALQINAYGTVLVDLGSENFYSASYISKLFGGLVTEYGYSVTELKKKLQIVCESDQSFVSQAWLEIEEAKGQNYGW